MKIDGMGQPIDLPKDNVEMGKVLAFKRKATIQETSSSETANGADSSTSGNGQDRLHKIMEILGKAKNQKKKAPPKNKQKILKALQAYQKVEEEDAVSFHTLDLKI